MTGLLISYGARIPGEKDLYEWMQNSPNPEFSKWSRLVKIVSFQRKHMIVCGGSEIIENTKGQFPTKIRERVMQIFEYCKVNNIKDEQLDLKRDIIIKMINFNSSDADSLQYLAGKTIKEKVDVHNIEKLPVPRSKQQIIEHPDILRKVSYTGGPIRQIFLEQLKSCTPAQDNREL